MRSAGVNNYREFALEACDIAGTRPISFEVLSEAPDEVRRQALALASLADTVFVKVPILTSDGSWNTGVISELSSEGVRLNITAIMTVEQVERVTQVLNPETSSVISIFAGRIADTGRDPVPIMQQAKGSLSQLPLADLLWASPREILNVRHAEAAGADIITLTDDLWRKFDRFDFDLHLYSIETSRMFFDDARAAGFTL
jgi:transaldolase